MKKQELISGINELETKIMIYSELADQVRIKELENELVTLNAQLLNIMSEEQDFECQLKQFENMIDGLYNVA